MKHLVAVFCLATLSAAPAIEMNPDAWDLLDYKGDVRMEQVAVTDCPPGFGPDVLRISGDVTLLLVRGEHLTDGTYVALYRERAAATKDADGVILFGGAYGDDLGLEHNTKTMRPHLWLEQDNDTGLSFRRAPAEGEDFAVAEAVATGLITDPWNVTGWIWQKVQVSGDTIRAKYWPAQDSEPDGWQLETTQNLPGDRFGIRINSGEIDLAHFAASADDINLPSPPYYLYLPRNTVGVGDALPLTLFSQDAVANEASYEVLNAANTVAAKGTLAMAADGTAQPIALPSEVAEGAYRLQLTLGDATLTRPFTIAPPSDTTATLRARRALLDTLEPHSGLSAELNETVQVATSLLDLAQRYYDQGESDRATETLRFIDETLVELHGPTGNALREANVILDWTTVPGEYDAETGVGNPKHGMQDHYRPESRIRFGEFYGVESYAMGREYTFTIPFEVVGAPPTSDYAIHVALRDPLGIRTVAETTINPDPPTSRWAPGMTYAQLVTLSIPRDDTRKGVSQPVVLDEMHDLIVSVRDETTGTHVLLDNPPGSHPNRVGNGYVAKQRYISSAPIVISCLRLYERQKGDEIIVSISNHGPALSIRQVIRVLAPSGVPIAEYAHDIEVPGDGGQVVRTPTEHRHRGDVTVDVSLYEGPSLLTRASLPIPPPLNSASPLFQRANHVTTQGTGSSTAITVVPPAGLANPLSVAVSALGNRLGATSNITKPTTLYVPPHFGYYDITATSGDTIWHERIVATVIETEGSQLLVNGEPFIVKGVNVHGMDGRSPARTRLMMDRLKDLGFNSLRGDYPPRWQIDMAHEVGMTYDVLAPFSVSSTAEVFGRQDGPPLGTARALTRQFIERYADAAAVLLWNSCNEIVDENIPFLLAQYPPTRFTTPTNAPSTTPIFMARTCGRVRMSWA